MPAVPLQRDWVNGDALTTTVLNGYISDPLRFLLRPPMARLRKSANQAVANSAWVTVTWDLEDVDTDIDGIGGHSTTNPSRYTARYPGWYQLSGGVTWTASTTSYRGTRWLLNSSPVNGSATVEAPTAAGSPSYAARTILVPLAVGDYVEMDVLHAAGAGISIIGGSAGGEQTCSMEVRWVSLL